MVGVAGRDPASEDFVKRVFDTVYLAAIRDTESLVAAPPASDPRPDLREMSEWWRSLEEADRAMVRRIIAMSADLAVFGFLCVLDNVMPVLESPDGTLRLVAVTGDETYPIPVEETTELHDFFAALVNDAAGPGADPGER